MTYILEVWQQYMYMAQQQHAIWGDYHWTGYITQYMGQGSLFKIKMSSPIVAQWCHMAPYIWVNIGSGTQPLPEAMLNYHQWGSVELVKDHTGSPKDIKCMNITNIYRLCCDMMWISQVILSITGTQTWHGFDHCNIQHGSLKLSCLSCLTS